MDDDVAVGRDDFTAMLLDDRIQRAALGDFVVRQDGIELFGVEVVINDLMPGRFQFVDCRGGDGVAEAAGVLVTDEDEDVHGLCFAIFTTFSPQWASIGSKSRSLCNSGRSCSIATAAIMQSTELRMVMPRRRSERYISAAARKTWRRIGTYRRSANLATVLR